MGERERTRAQAHDNKTTQGPTHVNRAFRENWAPRRGFRRGVGGARNDPGLSVKADWDSSALQGARYATWASNDEPWTRTTSTNNVDASRVADVLRSSRPVWKSNLRRPNASTRCCSRDRVGSMAWRLTKVHAIFLRITHTGQKGASLSSGASRRTMWRTSQISWTSCTGL